MTDIQTDFVPGSPRLAFDHAGGGDFVLFLHGIGGNRTNWHEQIEAFAPHFHAVAWDARGYGQSDDYDGPLDFNAVADDLARLMDHLGADAAHVVGLSMGCTIALKFYANHLARVASLTLSGGRFTADARTPEQRAEFIRLRQEPLLAGKHPRDMAPAVAKSLLAPTYTPAHFERLVDSMAALHVESYLKSIEAVTNFADWPDLSAFAVPTLMIYGADDRLNPPALGKAAAEKIPNGQFVELPSSGHLCNIETPEAFNDAVSKFLRSQ